MSHKNISAIARKLGYQDRDGVQRVEGPALTANIYLHKYHTERQNQELRGRQLKADLDRKKLENEKLKLEILLLEQATKKAGSGQGKIEIIIK